MKQVQIVSPTVERTIELGRLSARCLRADDVLVLCGDLGAGKTHFTKGVALGLGIPDQITSPTFNILRLYEGRAGYDVEGFAGSQSAPTLAHWDLYRLEDEDQLDDVDFYGIVESGVINIIEWGDKFPGAMPEEFVSIDISIQPNEHRLIEFTPYGVRGQELVELLKNTLA